MENDQLLEFDTFELEFDGRLMEFAITEEFDYEGKHYILCSEVHGDEINDEEVYLFRAIIEDTEIVVESIETEEEYDRIVEAYYEQNVEYETED